MNDRFAQQIIAHLVNHGVRRLCFSPGLRSSPLALSAAREPRLEKLIHFDERSMAFHAYGYAKGSKTPVAILTTSGSAAGHVFPAVMEAYHDHVPLIILTADRPTELQDCMANQACDQVKFFGPYVRWYAEIPVAQPGLSDEWLGTTVAQAIFRATQSPPGPVHLNCQFREPFFTSETYHPSPSTHYEPSYPRVAPATVQKWAEKLSSFQKGVVIAGGMPALQRTDSILPFAEKLGWPVLADLTSGLRTQASQATLIPYYVDLLKSVSHLQPDCILHLGDRVTSKPLLTWISESKPSTYLMVANHPFRHDPFHQVTHRIMTDPQLFCDELLPLISTSTCSLEEWKSLSGLLEENLETVISPLSEPGIIRYLHHHLPSHYALYCSNSMPVRDADRLFFPKLHRGPIFGQRGLSGIDGNIAAAIGLAEGTERPLVALLGDLAALHDLNSLAQLRHSKIPVILLVINNGGGGIFSFLPSLVQHAEPQEIFEQYIAGAHEWTFSKAAEMFKIPYLALSDPAQLHQALREEKTILIEFFSSRANNVISHQAIDEKSREVLERLFYYNKEPL
jgi:2-succinyl-5-enolpyruvyl-6-hydroxy-3-cyclohexene-1-carboxylate synthase